MVYHADIKGETASSSIDFTDVDHLDRYLWITFEHDISWIPEKLEVNGKKGRRVVCILAQDQHHYRVYDLDNFHGEEVKATQDQDTSMHIS